MNYAQHDYLKSSCQTGAGRNARYLLPLLGSEAEPEVVVVVGNYLV
jgi:hypothetical protein